MPHSYKQFHQKPNRVIITDMKGKNAQNQKTTNKKNTTDNNQQISSNSKQDNNQKPKQTKSYILRVIITAIVVAISVIGMLILLINLFFEGYLGDSPTGASVYKFQNYLETKYGKNENFSYTGNQINCPLFNSDVCELLFTSEKSGNEFRVRYTKHSSEFSDQYYLAKYHNELENYYYEKYGKYFENIIPYNYDFSIDVTYPYFSAEEKQNTFKQVINDIEKDENYNKAGININIDIDYKTIGFEEIENLDFESLKPQIKNIVQENEMDIRNVYLVIKMIGSENVRPCPSGYGSGHSKSKNEEKMTCRKNLYSKYRE